jgi:hypothetical protein
MSVSQFGAIFSSRPFRPKVFLSYHHKGDQSFYEQFSKTFHDVYETVFDNSLERKIDSDNSEYIMRRIREEFITGTSCTIVLVGPETWGRKYVDWEIEATLEKKHGLIGVQLPTATPNPITGLVSVPDRFLDNLNSKFALWVSWADITASAARLNQCIADATGRSKALIANDRERRLRNA